MKSDGAAGPSSKTDSVAQGVGLTMGLHIIGQAVLFLPSGAVSIFLIGLSQLIYVVPAYVIARKNGYPATARGIAIMGGITFLLNAGCTVIVLALVNAAF